MLKRTAALSLFLVVVLGVLAMAPVVGAQDATELSFWTFVPAHQTFWEDSAARWNEANPDRQITLNATTSEYQAMHDNLLAALLSGVGAPDLVDIEIAKFPTFMKGEIQLYDLTDVVAPYSDVLLQTRLAPYQKDGAQYGIDYHVGTFVMYYNKDVMDAAGVDIDSIRTWDDYVEAGKQVTADTNGDGEIDRWMTHIETADRFSALALQLMNGGGIYDADGNFILTSQENIDAVQFVKDMIYDSQIASLTPGTGNHDQAFYDAMVQGMFGSVWMPQWYMIRFSQLMTDLDGKILVRPMPVFEEGGYTSTMGGGTGTAITLQIAPEKLQLAMDFMAFTKLERDATIRIWTDLGFDPLRTDIYDDPALAAPLEYFGNESVFTTIKELQSNLAVEYLGPLYADAVDVLRSQTYYEIFANNADVATALQAAADQVEQAAQ
ncbi:MAG: ABC transporter substrate-binding protein [Anaerolineae bacterium]|nr:ABC transporter substrate-binding protein [Anaerolineae bacterium]